MDRKVYGTSPRGEMLEDRGVLPREDGDLLRDTKPCSKKTSLSSWLRFVS